jgi:hypothetical protein
MNQALVGNAGMMDEEQRQRPPDNPVLPNAMVAVNRSAYYGSKGKATKSELLKVLSMQCRLLLT